MVGSGWADIGFDWIKAIEYGGHLSTNLNGNDVVLMELVWFCPQRALLRSPKWIPAELKNMLSGTKCNEKRCI